MSLVIIIALAVLVATLAVALRRARRRVRGVSFTNRSVTLAEQL